MPGFWHGLRRRCAGQIVSGHPFELDAVLPVIGGVAAVVAGHTCSQNLAQLPFSLARDKCPVPDKLAVATWALSRSWHNFTLRRAGERGSTTGPPPGSIRGDLLRCGVTDTVFGTLPAH